MEIAPCVDKCPINLPIPDYIRKTCEGRFEEAHSLIVKEVPIPSILGRICFHPCEDACRRKEVDEALSICNIKRFLGDYSFSLPQPRVFQKERIAIVGGGPAGISCAWQLLQLGYPVDIFEERESLGGMPYISIPSWRLPLEILKKEIKNLISAGFSVKTKKRLGRDFGLEELKREYNAIVIACGLPLSREIENIKGEDVILALEFLEAIKFNKKVSLGKKVVVIGGGNVAIDCARAALRMGSSVSLVCLEDYENMPCFKEEKRAAEEEGIKILGGFGPKGLRNKQIVFTKVLSLFDSNKRFSPQFNEDETKTFDFDTIIMAIGQRADWPLLEKGGIRRDMLSENGVGQLFACGDIVQGPTNVASAIASGKRCAMNIHLKFRGQGSRVRGQGNLIPPISEEIIPFIAKRERIKPEALSLEERRCSFNEIEKTFTKEDVFLEGSRCLYCGKNPEQKKEICPLCLTCIRICPLKGIKKEERRPVTNPLTCQSCGICAAFCPDNAIRQDEFFLEDKYPPELEISCFDHPSSNGIRVRCLLSIGIPLFLSFFERGVERILIKPCPDSCFVPSLKRLVSKMKDRLKAILKEISEDKLRITVCV